MSNDFEILKTETGTGRIISIRNRNGNYIQIGDNYTFDLAVGISRTETIRNIDLKNGEWVVTFTTQHLRLGFCTKLARTFNFDKYRCNFVKFNTTNKKQTPYYEIY